MRTEILLAGMLIARALDGPELPAPVFYALCAWIGFIAGVEIYEIYRNLTK